MSTFIQEILGLLQSQRKKTTLKPDIDYIEFGRLGESTLNTGTSYAPKMQAYTMRMDDFIVAMGDSDTKYDLNSSTSGSNVNINLVPSTGSTDVVILEAGTNITLTNTGTNQITIDATHPVPGGYFGGRLSNNITPTVIVLVNTFYPVNFEWANVLSNLWSVRTNGSGYDSGFQYTGTPTGIFNIICSFSLTGFPVGDLVTFALFKNSVIITGSEQEMESSSLYYSVGTVQSMISVETDDYIELWVTSNNSLSVILQTVSVSVTAV